MFWGGLERVIEHRPDMYEALGSSPISQVVCVWVYYMHIYVNIYTYRLDGNETGDSLYVWAVEKNSGTSPSFHTTTITTTYSSSISD